MDFGDGFLDRLRVSVFGAFDRDAGVVTVKVTPPAHAQLLRDMERLAPVSLLPGGGATIFTAPMEIVRLSAEGASVRIGKGEHEFVPLVLADWMISSRT